MSVFRNEHRPIPKKIKKIWIDDIAGYAYWAFDIYCRGHFSEQKKKKKKSYQIYIAMLDKPIISGDRTVRLLESHSVGLI